jgi:hypothetical protein
VSTEAARPAIARVVINGFGRIGETSFAPIANPGRTSRSPSSMTLAPRRWRTCSRRTDVDSRP